MRIIYKHGSRQISHFEYFITRYYYRFLFTLNSLTIIYITIMVRFSELGYYRSLKDGEVDDESVEEYISKSQDFSSY